MRVVFDQQIFEDQRYGGISRYFVELARNIRGIHGWSAAIAAPLHINGYLSDASEVPGFHHRADLNFKGAARLRASVNRLLAPGLNRYLDADLVHATYYRKATRRRGRPLVTTVYDMIHELHPSQFPPDDPTAIRKRAAVESADHVICISEQTRADVINILGVRPEKTSVTYLAHSFPIIDADSSLRSTDRKPVILYVGQRGGYKNFDVLLQAFAASTRLRATFRLVCFGGFPLSTQENQQFSKLGLSADQVSHVQGTDEDLQRAYRDAEVFVYPSLYEGFGIPPLEAMACGCAVVASHTSSIPEVVGDAAELFDPKSVESLSMALDRACFDSGRRAELVRKGFERQAKFSWKQCALDTVAVYQSL